MDDSFQCSFCAAEAVGPAATSENLTGSLPRIRLWAALPENTCGGTEKVMLLNWGMH